MPPGEEGGGVFRVTTVLQKVIDMPYKDSQKAKEHGKLYYQKNKEKLRLCNIQWRKNNPEKSNAIYARYRATEKRRKISREWARVNRKAGMKRFVERYASDPQFNLAIKFRRRIFMAVRNQFTKKAKTTIDLLGTTYPKFKEYIENKFTNGMNWHHVLSGKIHLDHIRPVSLFDLTDTEQQKSAFHYTNLQPLWAQDNRLKHTKLMTEWKGQG